MYGLKTCDAGALARSLQFDFLFTCNMLRLHWACLLQEALPTFEGHDWLVRNVTLRLLPPAAVASAVIGQLDDLFEVCGFALARQAVLVLRRLNSVHHGGTGGGEHIQFKSLRV